MVWRVIASIQIQTLGLPYLVGYFELSINLIAKHILLIESTFGLFMAKTQLVRNQIGFFYFTSIWQSISHHFVQTNKRCWLKMNEHLHPWSLHLLLALASIVVLTNLIAFSRAIKVQSFLSVSRFHCLLGIIIIT